MILQNIEKRTDLGKKAHEMLLKGHSVPGLVVAQMIENKINSPEVTHHGKNNTEL